MSLWLEREAGKLTKAQDKGKAVAAKMLIATSKAFREAYGEIPFPDRETAEHTVVQQKAELIEPDLDAEWQRQTQRYIKIGFHTELGLSAEEYLASLPKFEPQPEAFAGRFDMPVLVETRIAPQCQAELGGLNYYLKGLNVHDWKDDPKGYKTPDAPYATWMQDGKKNLNINVHDVRNNLAADERGATEYDGIALWITNPSVLNDHSIDLPGTQVGSGYAPYLRQWNGRPWVSDRYVDGANSRFGSASCGRVVA